MRHIGKTLSKAFIFGFTFFSVNISGLLMIGT